ncbi:MAG TPA: hypothetical protein VKD43_12095 [Xanthobacteraceae bacterium]|nr:hypothetical protein [Xanthobacteraceae bacterium]
MIAKGGYRFSQETTRQHMHADDLHTVVRRPPMEEMPMTLALPITDRRRRFAFDWYAIYHQPKLLAAAALA